MGKVTSEVSVLQECQLFLRNNFEKIVMMIGDFEQSFSLGDV